MTAQISDNMHYLGKKYSLAGYSANEPFNPESLGFKPVGACSACWRGYVIDYAIDEMHHLFVQDIALSLFDVTGQKWKDVLGSTINGVSPRIHNDKNDFESFLNNRYSNINMPLDYTGGILLADEFIPELYVHMGFHPAWKFREVHELIFDSGVLIKASDKSAEMARLRELVPRETLEPTHGSSKEEITVWVDRCFDRKYT